MEEQIGRKAGNAFFWRGVQHAGGKVIFLIRLLVLARLLSPDDFGLLAVSMVALEIMTKVTNFGMIPALVQYPTTDEAHYHTAWTVGMLRAVAISCVVFLTASIVAKLFDEPRAALLIQGLAIRPLLEASASIKVAELIRNLRFRSLTFIKLPEAFANTAIAIVLAPSMGVWALVAGALAGPTAVLILSYIFAPYRPRFSMDREAAKSLIRFGRWIFLIGILAVSGSSILRLIVSRQLGTMELGLYYLGASLAFLPVEIVSQVVGEVTFPLYARLQENKEKARQLFQSILIGIYSVLTPVTLLLIALAPAVVTYVLGPKWEGTEPVIRILAFANLIGMMGDTIVPILKGLGRPSKVVIIEIIQTLLLIIGALIFTRYWGLAGVAFAWLPSVIIAQLISGYILREFLPSPFSGLSKAFSVIAMVSLAGAFLASWIYEIIPGLSGLIIAITLASTGIGLALWISDRRLALGMTEDLARAFPKIATKIGHKTIKG